MLQNRVRTLIPTATWGYLLILGVIVVGAIMREINLLIILSGLMVGPLVINWQLVRSTLRHLSIRHHAPAAVFPEQPFAVEIELTNHRTSLDSWALHLDDTISRITADGPGELRTAICFLPHVPASQSRKVTYNVELTTRGRYRLGPTRISTRMPAGLLEGRVRSQQTREFRVWPRLGVLQSGWQQLARFDQTGNQSWRRRQGVTEGDFFGLREWRSGDSRRWIHWRSSAKRDDLIVRQFEQQRHEDLIVILDLGRWHAEAEPDTKTRRTAASQSNSAHVDSTRLDSTQAVENAISFVATLISERCQQGSGGLTLTLADAAPRCLRGAASLPMLHELLDVLAEATPTSDDPLPAQLSETLSGTSPHDRIIWVSPQPIVPQEQRCAAWSDHDQPTARLGDAIRVDTSDRGFTQLFAWEAPSLPPPAGRAPAAMETVH